jgi:hypothetical protein
MSMKPYGPAIFDAIERGDAARLRSALASAKGLHKDQGGDLGKAIKSGEAALKKLATKRGKK